MRSPAPPLRRAETRRHEARSTREMRRSIAHLLAAGSTILFLEGAAIGLAAASGWGQAGAPAAWSTGWSHLAATAAWVIALLAPAVAWLESRRRRVWPAAFVAGLVAAVVRLALDWRDGPSAAAGWSLVDGVGLALGLLFYDLLFGLLRAARAR